jgi:DNA polymerase III alpha subunit
MIPQLRVRSGYSFKNAYGRTPEILAQLKAIGCPAAAMVDTGTWGHVRWEQAMLKAELQPMFGMETPILGGDFKPVAWFLAEDMRLFYNLTSKSVQAGGLTPEEFGEAQGVVKFIGGALTLDPDTYDYIDVNPSSYTHAYQAVQLSRRTGKPMVLTSYNDMPSEAHKSYAYAWEVRDSVGLRHILTEHEMRQALRYAMSGREFDTALDNTLAVAKRLEGTRLRKAPMIKLEGDLVTLAREGQASRLARGHIKEWTQVYEDRFQMEIEAIKRRDFDSYFLIVADLVQYAKRHMLVGPARGSSAGSLICYLLAITEIDPIQHDLLFYRFIDISRMDLPDIDIDFSDSKRYMVFEYLQNKYGHKNVCKLGNINTLKAASVLAQVGRKFGIHVSQTSQISTALIEYSSADERYGKGLQDTMTRTGPGREFSERYPEASECMGDIEIHPSHSGVHAAGILICNDPIADYCTINADNVAQIDKKNTEHLNLLKIDALGLRTLGIIEDAGVVTAEELYSLPLDDKAVLDILNEDKVCGIFQFEGDIVRTSLRMVYIDQFSKIDNVTALARPGPLSSGMSQRYIERAAGREPVTYEVPQLEKYLKDTFGVFLYQEQIMMVVQEIGGFDWKKTSAVRKAMSGSMGEEFFNSMGGDFVKGAVEKGVPEKEATEIWREMVTFGAWGFNKSHSVSYAVVTYWTCWMKRYHMLEFAAATLRAAKDADQTIAMLRELAREGVTYTPIDPDYSDINWTVADGRLLGGIRNAKGYGPVKALQYVQKRAAGLLTDKDRERLANAEVKYTELYEARALWGHFYDNPELAGVTSGRPIIGMKTAKDGKMCITIAKLTKKTISDENEAIKIKKRGGKLYKGQSQFLDLMMLDDSTDTSMRFRIRPERYLDKGKPIAENAPTGSWFLVLGKKIPGLDMFIVHNIKQLDKSVAATRTA